MTFSGVQSIKLTINNLRPSDLILDAEQAELLRQLQQRPLLELSAQFGSIKCLICPKQIHLLTEMVNRLNEYIEAANSNMQTLKLNQRLKPRKSRNKVIRGCGKREFDALVKNELLHKKDEEEEDDDNYKSFVNHSDPEASVMFYSMMSESSAGFMHASNLDSESGEFAETNSSENSPRDSFNNDDDKAQYLLSKELKQTIEQLQNDVIVSNTSKSNATFDSSQTSRHNLFQTFKVTI